MSIPKHFYYLCDVITPERDSRRIPHLRHISEKGDHAHALVLSSNSSLVQAQIKFQRSLNLPSTHRWLHHIILFIRISSRQWQLKIVALPANGDVKECHQFMATKYTFNSLQQQIFEFEMTRMVTSLLI